jgi:hypothetical protein
MPEFHHALSGGMELILEVNNPALHLRSSKREAELKEQNHEEHSRLSHLHPEHHIEEPHRDRSGRVEV